MSANGQAVRPNIFPGIRYRDERRAINWLTRAFGFRKGCVQ